MPLGIRDQSIVHRSDRLQKKVAGALAQKTQRGCRERRRIQTSAHEHADAPRSQPIAQRAAQQLPEPVRVLVRTLEVDRLFHGQRPVAPALRHVPRPGEGVGGRQPPDVSKRCGVDLLVDTEQQEVCDRRFVQFARHPRVQADAVECVAEENRLPELRVKERLDAELIPRAKQTLSRLVPDRKREVPEQPADAIFAPDIVGAENQFDVRRFEGEVLLALRPEVGDEIMPGIDPRVGDDPSLVVEREGLRLARRLLSDPQQRMTEADVVHGPGALAVWTPKAQVRRHSAEQVAIDWRSVQIQNTDNAAHARSCDASMAGPATISFWPSSRWMNSSRSARNCAGSTSYSPSSAS